MSSALLTRARSILESPWTRNARLGLGMIIAATALLRRVPHPTEADIREALRHNLCRCGAHVEILRAVQRAAGTPA